ncbi:hypothetical protein ACFQ3R_02225 [Mesonia ostreae]|uniref:Uncharacterized protein n=1 Tax=Mesonia ostreae TaxID=861110 RepID=A0ABU2KLE1_9FLAO|nr:hypothetical protein [Mesonia ostreae]MDT0295535.1 hypothetical protein [Mesonia ostreae]
MNNKIVLLCLLSLFGWNGFSQTMRTIDDFKYVVIPLQYKMSKEDNEFRLNSTTKYLLKQEGFTTFMETERFPKDLVFNQCLALYAELESGTTRYFSLNTKVTLKLKDCFGNVVFETREAVSKKKNVSEAYKEALIKTFNSFNGLQYEYNGNMNEGLNRNRQKNKMFVDENVEEVQEKEEEISTSTNTLAELVGESFLYKNEIFTLKEIEAGYLLMDANGDRQGFINTTSTGNILYNSERLNGSLIILEKGDLQVEYFNKETGKLDQAIFKKQA